MDAILEGSSEEYNPFMMQIYGKLESSILYDVETLFHVHQILSLLNDYVNLAHSNHSQNSTGFCGGYSNFQGKGHNNCERGCGGDTDTNLVGV